MGIVTVACVNTGEQVPIGVIADAATFATTDFQDRKFRCDACSEVHSWNKADAMVQPDNVRPSGRVQGSRGFGRNGRGFMGNR